VVPNAAEQEAALPSDDEIVDAIASGKGEAAEALYDRLSSTVDGTLLRVLGKRDVDHDDLVQTAFEQIFLSIARHRFNRACSLRSWAVSIATNIGLNTIRKRRSERRYIDHAGESGQIEVAGPVGDPLRAAQVAVLREELARLSPETAKVILLFEVMGCPLDEIAVAMGLTVAAAQSRLVRGRAELRSRFEARRGLP
jgi:RNA polymerase sigma-70 factor (ECF subfamily)